MYLIGSKLWPEKAIAGPVPSFDEVLARIPGVAVAQDSPRCYAGENVEGSDVSIILARIGLLASQPNQVSGGTSKWSGGEGSHSPTSAG
jgi:hypothetical protein